MNIKSLLKNGSCGLFVGGMLVFAMPAEAAVTGSYTAGVYEGRLDRHPTTRVYQVAGQDDVPYISAEEYLSRIVGGNITYSMDGDKLIATRNGSSVVFDTAAQVISFDAWYNFLGTYDGTALPNGAMDSDDLNAIAVSTMHPSSEVQDKALSINLAHYGLSMEKLNGKVLVPFAVLQNVFGVPMDESKYSYNGSDFYDLHKADGYIYGNLIDPHIRRNPYADAYYSGEFSKRKAISPAYAKYAYGTTCLLFNLYYGHREEKGIEDFDVYLEQNGLKEKLLSTNAKVVSQAFQELVGKLFDSGHDSVHLFSSAFDGGRQLKTSKILKAYGNLDSMVEALRQITYKVADMGVDFKAGDTGYYDQYKEACSELRLNPVILDYIFRDDSGKPYNNWMPKVEHFLETRNKKDEEINQNDWDVRIKGDETKTLLDMKAHMDSLKPKDFPRSKVDFVDDTAFIYFERFSSEFKASDFYYHTPAAGIYDYSTFGLFYDAFEQIQKKPWIKKVVIDLSNNGGGHVSALVTTLGFLSPDGEVNFNYQHTLTKNFHSEWYHVDTNLDGKFDVRDGFGGKYKFYILTSGFSYSSANALPFFAQSAGLAKIIGAAPGGGDCEVAKFLDAYGHAASMSGYRKLGYMSNGQFVSDEHAVKVDYPFGDQADKLYYNYKAIAQWLKDK